MQELARRLFQQQTKLGELLGNRKEEHIMQVSVKLGWKSQLEL